MRTNALISPLRLLSLLAIVLFFIGNYCCYAQGDTLNKRVSMDWLDGHEDSGMEKMTGLCEFRLGKTNIQIIDTISKKLKKKVIHHAKKFYFSNEQLKLNIYELEVDSLDKLSFSHPKHPKHRRFVFSGYRMCDTYELGEVELDFYDGILYHFTIKDNCFLFDFFEKYGMPNREKLVDKHPCDLPSGDVIEFDDESERMRWYNDDIKATYLKFAQRDRKTCKITYEYSFSMWQQSVYDFVSQLDDEIRRTANQKFEKERSGILKKL